jgi:uncharacterized protein DUF3313
MKRSTLTAAAFASLICGQTLADPPQQFGDGSASTNMVTLAHVRPGTDWTKYTSILVQPVGLPANARNDVPPGAFPASGDSYLLSREDVYDLQNVFSKSMHNVLGDHGFTIATMPDAHTLVVVPQVMKITFNAPVKDKQGAYGGLDYALARSGSAIEIRAVLADGATGKVIAEVVDRNYDADVWALDRASIHWTQARPVFDQWADDLSHKLRSP